MFRNGLAAVAAYIADGNAMTLCRVEVDIVSAGSGKTDESQIGAIMQQFVGQADLVGQHITCVAYSLRYLVGFRDIVNLQLRQ